MSASRTARATEAPGRRAWPGLFVVGAAKAGTTSLHRWLARHPDVFMSELKEPHFFSDIPADERRLLRFVRDESEYLQLFAAASGRRVIGESSTSYLWDARAAARIRERVPDARIVVLVRDPVERAWSHFLMDVREGHERGGFAETVRRDWESAEKGWGVSHLYVELGLYAEQIARFDAAFGKDRVRVIVFEEMISDPMATLRDLAGFLEIDEAAMSQVSTSEAHNPYLAPRSGLAARVLGSKRFTGLRRWLPPGARRLVRSRFLLRREAKPRLEPEAEEFLKPLFSPDVRRVAERLGRLPWPRFGDA